MTIAISRESQIRTKLPAKPAKPAKPANDNKKLGKTIRLDPSDERSLEHPSHDEQWFEVARAIGRQMARDELDGRSGQQHIAA
jgi:hypothetical protein